MKIRTPTTLTAMVLAIGALTTLPALAAGGQGLPAATRKIMAETKLPMDLLNGLGQEMKVPQAWIDGAKKEGELVIGGTWDLDQFAKMAAPFKERYPYINVKYSRATRHDRVIKPLLAYKEGRVVTDILSGVGAKFSAFKKLNAYQDLRVLPNWDNVPDGMKGKDGGWVGSRLRYWCMSYNTNLVKKKDLPETWGDLLTNPRWYNGKIGMGNRPNLWLLAMWDDMGAEGVRAYVRKLFAVVKPQLRKEGMNALISLVAAGEFDMALPSAAYRTSQLVAKGAPVSFHCPSPVPLAVSELMMMKGGHTYAGLLFMNWFLSREGQIAQFAANKAPPIHKALKRKEFLSFPDEILGKKVAFRDPTSISEDLPKLMKIWNPMWFAGRGLKLQTVTATLDAVTKKGRRIAFKVDGKPQTAKISSSRTTILVDGDEAGRADIKPGMSCEINYPGNREEVVQIDCKEAE